MNYLNAKRTRLWVSGLILVLAASPALAEVNLELRPESETAEVGDVVNIGLYAVSADDEVDEAFAGLQVILEWDPAVLTFIGLDDNGPYNWYLSAFVDDSGLDGLNDTFSDGDAFYMGIPNLSDLPVATPTGLLITTLKFEAMAPSDETFLDIPESAGNYTVTAVYDDEIPNTEVTGILEGTSVSIEGDSEPPCEGDANGDNVVNPLDAGFVLSRIGCKVGGGDPDCDSADQNSDGLVDPLDIGFILSRFGPCN